MMYNPKTPTDVLKNQAGIDGNERVSIERAVEDMIKMMPKKSEEPFLGKRAYGRNEVIDEVHQIFKGGL